MQIGYVKNTNVAAFILNRFSLPLNLEIGWTNAAHVGLMFKIWNNSLIFQFGKYTIIFRKKQYE